MLNFLSFMYKVLDILSNVGIALIFLLLTIVIFVYTIDYVLLAIKAFALILFIFFVLYKLNSLGMYIVSKIKGG